MLIFNFVEIVLIKSKIHGDVDSVCCIMSFIYTDLCECACLCGTIPTSVKFILVTVRMAANAVETIARTTHIQILNASKRETKRLDVWMAIHHDGKPVERRKKT